MHSSTVAFAILSCVGVLTGCGGDDDSPASTTTSVPPAATGENTQIGNPASQYCIDQGGRLEIVDEAEGQVGYCNLPNGNRVEEWELFRSANG